MKRLSAVLASLLEANNEARTLINKKGRKRIRKAIKRVIAEVIKESGRKVK